MSKVVISDIPFGSAYAYRVGDPIEDEAVKQNGWQDYVASPGTKAANEALGIEDAAPVKSAPKKSASKRSPGSAPAPPQPPPAPAAANSDQN